jgi:predicted ArsR family transcriptional regulator
MQSTRERILHYLEGHPPASAEELGRYLEMTPANIRYHLDILEEEGLIHVVGKRPTGGAGRPILLYSLTSFSLGDNLEPLLKGIFAMLGASDHMDQTLEKVAQQMIRGKLLETKNRIERFNQGIEVLNSMNYHANWEARPYGPRIELRHCPYRELAKDYPILCQLDHKLLEGLFNTPLSVIQLQTKQESPFSTCIFHSE